MPHYGTLDAAEAYHTARGNVAWLASAPDPMPVPPPEPDPAWHTEEQRTAALVRASASLDGQYGARFSGSKATRAQALQWPRVGARDACVSEDIPQDEVPVEIENAAYALALVELLTPGASSPFFTPGAVNKVETVDVISRTRFGPSEGVALTLEAQRVQLAEVEDWLRCVLKPKGGTVWLERV